MGRKSQTANLCKRRCRKFQPFTAGTVQLCSRLLSRSGSGDDQTARGLGRARSVPGVCWGEIEETLSEGGFGQYYRQERVPK